LISGLHELNVKFRIGYRIKKILINIRFKLWARKTDKEKATKEITAVVFTVDPNHLLDDCLESIQKQTIGPVRVVIIRNVKPISRAFQEGMESVKTPYYISVDGDMILHPKCFEWLYYGITRNSNRAEVILRLHDPILGPLWGIRMYRTAALGDLRFHPTQEKGPERMMRKNLIRKGFDCARNPYFIAGKHHPVYLPHEIFWKYRFIGEKVLFYGDNLAFHIDKLCQYWINKKDMSALYGFYGLFDGLMSSDISQQLDYEGRERHPKLLQIENIFKAHAIEKWIANDVQKE